MTSITSATKATSYALTEGAASGHQIFEAAAGPPASQGLVQEPVAGVSQDRAINDATRNLDRLQQIAQAYQDLSVRNAVRLTDFLQEFSNIKTPTQYFELQQKFLTENLTIGFYEYNKLLKLNASTVMSIFGGFNQKTRTAPV